MLGLNVLSLLVCVNIELNYSSWEILQVPLALVTMIATVIWPARMASAVLFKGGICGLSGWVLLRMMDWG